jgi:MurNAc alpha-1-phosphate uridylyltransferase
MAEASSIMTAPKRAMVLAAGLGTRMRSFNGRIPKPLVAVGGKALIDYVLDRLAEQGVERAVVNVHHLADQIERHLEQRQRPSIVISDERDELLGTGGGVVKALPDLGEDPFFHVNSDTIWIDGVKPNLGRLAAAFDPARMDALLLVAPTASSIGYAGRGDPHPRLLRRGPGRRVLDVAVVRPGGGRRAALWPSPRWRLDACRHARGDQSRRGGHPRQRGLIV